MKHNTTILNAVNTLVDTVKVTLGAKGRTVLYNTDENKPHITKDGVSVARHIASADDYENMLITVIREASVKTMRNSGDGTTTTLVLTQYLITEGLKLLSEGISYYELSKSLDKAKKQVLDYITAESISVESNPEVLKHVASIASNDEAIGEFIYSIIQDIGLYGDIQVKTSSYSETKIDKSKGMKLHKGWFEGFMVNNTRDMTFEATDCFVLLMNETIRSMSDIVTYVDYSIRSGKALVVFCDDVSDITLKQLKNFMESNPVPLCFVENDGFRDNKEILLNDLAAITGGYVITTDNEFDPSNLGIANEIKVEELYTTVLGGNTDTQLVNDIIEDIKARLEVDDNEDEMYLSGRERKWYKKRLANLTGGVAVIHAGGDTEMEMKELKDRLDDAVLAVYSAIQEGVCIGGGYTFVRGSNKIKGYNKGEQLVYDSLLVPFKQLLINADLYKDFDLIRKGLIKGKGFDLRTESLTKIDSYNVYDSAGVLKDCIRNSIAVSKSILSVKKLIYDGVVQG